MGRHGKKEDTALVVKIHYITDNKLVHTENYQEANSRHRNC